MGHQWIFNLYRFSYCHRSTLVFLELRVGLVSFWSFLYFYISTGMSITVGYHRLFSHKAFQAKWPIKLYVLLFGAAAFENSALWWSSEHRKHHKHVDTDDDPYDITKGFFWAHMGWLMFKLKPDSPLDNVEDLKKDRLVSLQHKFVHPLSFFGKLWITITHWISYMLYTLEIFLL